jgi:hypothetical protein
MRFRLAEQPAYQLTAHFFRGLFTFGVLSDAGSDAFRRVVIAVVVFIVSVGLLVTRMYLAKYSTLSLKFLTGEPYQLAILGDGALVIALPMLIVGLVAVLVSNSLFPDEIDMRILLPLPISRRVVFASKALAVMLFAGLFIIAAHVAMTPIVVLMSNSRWSDHGMLTRLVAYALASVGGSIVTVLMIMAVTGALLVCVPRSRLQLASIAFRGAALCGLVLMIPLVRRLPMTGPLLARESALFYVVPPAWFLGVEQWLLGNTMPYFLRLAQLAAVAALASFAVALGSYLFLYRRFEKLIFRPRGPSPHSRHQRISFPAYLRGQHPAASAIVSFIRATLTRSPLHQGVFVAIAAGGAGLVLNGFLSDLAAGAPSNADESLIATVIWAPFVLVFAMNVAARAALALPLEPRANWIFRVTEDEAARADALSIVARTVIVLGVVLPLAMLFPVEWAVLGPRAAQCTSIAFLCGVVLVELHMAEWRRIPFTCTYEPTRQGLGRTMVVGFTGFVLFTTIGSRLVRYSVSHTVGWLVVVAILSSVWLYLRHQRRWLSRHATLVFEEVLPNEVEPLRLSEY